MKYINYKKIMAITISGFVLSQTACTNTKACEINKIETSIDDSDITYNSEKINDYKDQEIINYFKKTKNQILNSQATKKAKKKIVNSFITMTDFIFYDKPINGITYDELKEGTKQNILETYFEVDGIIESKFPNYKDKLNQKYNIIKNWLEDKYNSVIDKGKENLSDDSIHDIIKTKEELKQLKEVLQGTKKSLYSDAVQKTKSWYEEFRNKNR